MSVVRKHDLLDIVLYVFLFLLAVITIIPIWYVFVISISTYEDYVTNVYHLIPGSFSLQAYINVLRNLNTILRSLMVSVQVTALGTAISLVLTTLGAYALSKNDLPGRKLFSRIIIVTMFFDGGLIPFYLLVTGLGFTDTILALTIPIAVSPFYIIIMKSYYSTIPESLEQSAKIDGYNDVQILFKIIMPVSMPIVITISLFYGLMYWNDYFNGVLFINSSKMFPFQVVLRQMVVENQAILRRAELTSIKYYNQVKAVIILMGMIPILIIYPLIQKYFSQGIMLGAVKG